MIVFSVALENKEERDIDAVVGRVIFTDMFGKDVAFQMFKFEDTFKAGTTAQWKANHDFNEFNSNDKMLATLRKGKYTTRFIPEAVVFSDGTKLSVS